MDTRHIAPAALTALLVLTSACASAGKSEGQRRIETLSERIDDLVDDLERERSDLVSALVAHDAMVGLKDADLLARYKGFNRRLRSGERRLPRLDERLLAVREASEAWLAGWEADLTVIESDRLRRRSGERLARTRDLFERFVAKVEAVRADVEPILVELRDHATFLGNDLNAQSVALLEADTKALQARAKTIYAEFEAAVAAGREFNRTIAMSVDPEAAGS